jgi:hypothetical protein
MRHIESHIQQSCIRWFDYQFPELSKCLFAVPNGGARNKREAGIMKGEGVRAGVADLILLVPRGGFGALCIELKSETGKQSKEQKEWQRQAELAGNKYVVCRDVEAFSREVKNYLSNRHIVPIIQK